MISSYGLIEQTPRHSFRCNLKSHVRNEEGFIQKMQFYVLAKRLLEKEYYLYDVMIFAGSVKSYAQIFLQTLSK